MTKDNPHFDLEREQDRVRIILRDETLSGRDDVDDLFRHLDEILNMTPRPDLMIDFRHIKHIASVFLGKLMAYHRQVKQRGGKLRLVNVHPNVHEVFHLTRINEQISIDAADEPDRPVENAAMRKTIFLSVAAAAIVAALAIIWAMRSGMMRQP